MHILSLIFWHSSLLNAALSAGHSSQFFLNLAGPFHHNSHCDRDPSVIPRDTRSAGVSAIGTCLQLLRSIDACIPATVFATKVFRSLDFDFSYANTIIESVKYAALIFV